MEGARYGRIGNEVKILSGPATVYGRDFHNPTGLYREGESLVIPRARRPAFYVLNLGVRIIVKDDGKVLEHVFFVFKDFFIFKFVPYN